MKDKIKCGDRVFVTKSEGINPSRATNLFRRQSSLVTNIKKGIASLYIIDRQYGTNHYAKAPIENLVKVYGKEEITIGMIVKIKKGVLAPTFVADKPFRVVSISKERGCELRAQIENDFNTHIDIPVNNLEPYYSDENIRKREEEFDAQAKEWFKNTISKEDAIKGLNPDEHRIDTPLQDLLTKERLESYRRSVAGQIAVKLANVDNRPPEEVGRYAVETATMVVKHLRDITI